jgi:CheY-like chemotaxis protein
MEVRLLTTRPSVLIVDEQEETHEVLRTVLERRGVQIFDARGKADGLELARRHQPDLIVLDLEWEADGEGTAGEFASQHPGGPTPLVLLGRLRRSQGGGGREIMAKPYHYGALIRKIEELLEEGQPPQADSSAA